MSESRELIYKLIREKSKVKQDVFQNTKDQFLLLKEVLKESNDDVSEKMSEDNRLEFYFKEKGEFEAEIKLAGDILIFHMHTNVFQFDKSHSLWRSNYLKDDETNGFVGIINVYNFLADSFKFQRGRDVGYLIARIFINRDNHFLVQGKRQLGFLYNDFIQSKLDKEKLRQIVDSAILYTLDFDLFAPPYQNQQEVSVAEMEDLSQTMNIATGKRLGFKFGYDNDLVE
jgi:hypothetical protein